MDKARLARGLARLGAGVVGTGAVKVAGQPWLLLPLLVAEGLTLYLEQRDESKHRRVIANLPASLGAALAEVPGLPEEVQTALQSRAAALVELVRREVAGLGLSNDADAEVAQEVVASFPERIAGTIGAFLADTATLTPRGLAKGLARDVNALLEPILGDAAEPIAEDLAGAIVVALAQDPLLRGPFEEAHREETRELARSVQRVLDRMGELDERLLRLDRLVAGAAGLPSAAMLTELVRWNREKMLDDHRRKLRRQLTRPLDEWRVRKLLADEGLDADSPETPRAYAYVPHTLERWDPRAGEAAMGGKLSLNRLEALLSPDRGPAAVLVQAQAGFGKSTFLHWLAVQWGQLDNAPLPVFVTLAELAAAGYGLAVALRQKLSFPRDWDMDDRLRQNAALGLVERGLVVALVDGLDQLQGAPDTVLAAAKRSNGARVIAACREELGPGAGLAGWTALVRLRHPRRTDFRRLVDEDVRKALEDALDGDDVRHPFFLHVARTIQHTGGGGLPGDATTAKLLDRYVRRLLEHGERRARAGMPALPRPPFDPEDWQLDVLGTLGLETLRSLHGQGDALQETDGKVWKHARQRAGERQPSRLEQVERFLDAARDRSHLVYLLERTEMGATATYRFHHQLVQEYLGALGIALRVEGSETPLETVIELVADVVSPRAVGAGQRGEPIESRVGGLKVWSMLGELLATRRQEFAERLVLDISTWLLDQSPRAVEQQRFHPLEISPLLAVRDAMVETLDRSTTFDRTLPRDPADPVVTQFEKAGVDPDPFMALCWEEERHLIRGQVASVADWLLEQGVVGHGVDEGVLGRLREACGRGDVDARIEALVPVLQGLLRRQEERLPDPPAEWEVRPHGPTLAAFPHGAEEPSWLLVPHGPFVAGDVEYGDELPVRVENVTRPFWVGFDPVTVEEFGRFVDGNGYGDDLGDPWWEAFDRPKLERALRDRREPWSWAEQRNQDDRPVVGLTWFEAAAYCLWRNGRNGEAREWAQPYRLPTEAEWEKAARGLFGRRWPWGCAWRPELVIHGGDLNLRNLSRAEENLNRSVLGTRGMAGNVWEWTATRWEQRTFGEEVELSRAGHEDWILLRGGSFNIGRLGVRCACRGRVNAAFRFVSGGCRCFRDVI